VKDTDDDLRGSDDELVSKHPAACCGDGPPACLPPLNSGGRNTGAKGVLEDYRIAKENMKRQMKWEAEEAHAQIEKNALILRGPQTNLIKPQEEEEEELDEDELEFLEKYREARLAQLTGGDSHVFGSVSLITRSNFIDAVENVPSNVYVVVHIFEEFVPACQLMNEALVELAEMWRHVKIVKMKSHEGTEQIMDTYGLPHLVVYMGGEHVNSFPRVHDHLPDRFNAQHVAAYLERNGVPSSPNHLSNQMMSSVVSAF